MATIHIDGQAYEVDGSDNLLAACLSLGMDIPYFCWHPELGSVGACRQCAVKVYKDESDTRGQIVMSCMTGAADKSWISIADQEAVDFRKSVVEWLMTNHPHDCPVCEEGGHCHLQDMTVMVGHHDRRYRFKKRTHLNQNLGPFINHEMNRCISCYRCVRYYRDYAGGKDLGVFGANNNVYFGRPTSGTLESPFSGNLTEVCPTGVFTDKPHSEHYTRKWDMQFSPSICHECSLGCNTSMGERYGSIRRIENRYHSQVNRYFLCDRGRFGYDYLNDIKRPSQPTYKGVTLTVDETLDQLNTQLKGMRIAGIGSPSSSLETNFALKNWVGETHFSTGEDRLTSVCNQIAKDILQHTQLNIVTLQDIESHDAVLILGEDLINTAPRMALAVRQAVLSIYRVQAEANKIPDWNTSAIKTIGRSDQYPLWILAPRAYDLSEIASQQLLYRPDEIIAFTDGLASFLENKRHDSNIDESHHASIEACALMLSQAKRPLIIGGVSLRQPDLILSMKRLTTVIERLEWDAGLALVFDECNSLGVNLLSGLCLEDILKKIQSGDYDALVVVENDLQKRLNLEPIQEALNSIKTLVVIDSQANTMSSMADFVLPSAAYSEDDGTLVNSEGRAQRYFQTYDCRYYHPTSGVHKAWRWISTLQAAHQNQDLPWLQFDQLTRACAKSQLLLSFIVDAAPETNTRILGQKIARSPNRSSGRTAMRAAIDVSEPGISQDLNSPLTFSMEGRSSPSAQNPLIPFAWSPGWNSPQAWNKFQAEVGGEITAGPLGVRLLGKSVGTSEDIDINAAYPQVQDIKKLKTTTSAVTPDPDELYTCPLHDVFSPWLHDSKLLKQRAGEKYGVINKQWAEQLGVQENSICQFVIDGIKIDLPVQLITKWPEKLLGIPTGLENIPLSLLGQRAHWLGVINEPAS